MFIPSFDPVSIAINLVILATTIAVSYYAKKDAAKKADRQKEAQLVVQTPIGPRIFAVGRVRLGGVIVFAESNLGSVYMAIAHCDGPIHQYRRRWLDDKDTNIPAGLLTADNLVYPWGSNISFSSHLGTAGQTADPILLSFPVGWTADHRLRGVAYTAILYRTLPARFFEKVYVGGSVPTLSSEIDGALVYDPRDEAQDWEDDATWAWSDNASLVILFFMTHRHGFGLGHARFDLASFAAFADTCDEDVPLAAGGTEKRYRLWGTWAANEARRTVLDRMLEACDGDIYTTREGKIAIRGGAWQEPEVTLTDDDMLSVEYAQGNESAVAFNLLRAKYTSWQHDYQETEAEPWEDLDSQALYGELSHEIALPLSPSHGQTRRIMKIATARENPRHRLSVTTKLSGLIARRERVIRLTVSDLGGLDATFRVERFVYDPQAQRCSLSLASLDADAYEWDAATEEGTAADVPDVPDVVLPPEPENIRVYTTPTEIEPTTFVVQVTAAADPPAGGVLARLVGQYRRVGDTTWLPMETFNDDLTVVVSPIVDVGDSYEVRVAYEAAGLSSAWSAIQTIFVSAYAARVTEAGDTRVTEDGQTRILEAA